MKQSDIDKIIKAIKEPIKEQIQESVNGKIDDFREEVKKRMEDHRKELEPVMQVYSTANNIGKFAKYISGILLAGAIIWALLRKLV